MNRYLNFSFVVLFVFFNTTAYTQMVLGKFDCNGNVAGEGNLQAKNYLDTQLSLSNLAVTGSAASLSYTDISVDLTLTGSVGPANCIYFSIAPKEGYIVEVRKINMNIKKNTKAGNVILYLNNTGQPFSGTNSTALYSAGNGNTDITYTVVNVSYPTFFAEPIKVTSTTQPANFMLSSGKDGGALSIDYITLYGYVYKTTDTPPSDGIDRSFNVDLNKRTGTVNPLFWGTNFLFWIEDDASLADGRIETSLKNLPIKSLRYPGGTVADNFHWKTNLLENKFRFPFEDGAAKSDFDEFMAFCARTNAEPVLVVNTESWQIAQDLNAGAQEAAEWVQYCKDKGYKVKYWEIGNETYWHPFFTAREYGQAVKKYAIAMKAVDPTIKISANGHWDVEMVGSKERTTSSEWETIRQMYLNIASRTDTEAADAYADSFKDTNITNGTQKWWNNVADECGAYIDMISVHWYYGGNTNMESMTTNLDQVRQVFKTKYPNRDYTMCMTEYNCNHDDHKLGISGLFDGIGRFLNAGVEIANFWPLRNSIDGHRRSIMHSNTLEEGYAYQVLQLMGKNLKGDLSEVVFEKPIFPLVSYDGKQLTVLVSGRSITTQPVYATMNLPEMGKFSLIDAKSYDAPLLSTVPIRLVENDVPVTVSETACTFKVMPAQTVMLRFSNDENTSTNKEISVPTVNITTEGRQILVTSINQSLVSVYNIQGVKIAHMFTNTNARLTVPSAGLYLVKVSSSQFVDEIHKIFVRE
jgi:hypothetical protein